ncbi:MAG TPA: hypothetical protein VF737_07185 [Gemmatimonadaceae bacterium]
MPDHRDDQLPVSRLEDAVARGIITAEQLRAIRDMPAGEAAPAERRPEARRGLNAVTIAYYVGGAAVAFAFGWYIVDRWDKLGAAGVLVVSLLYAGIFALTARYLGRLGYRTAAAVVTLLAVAMAPLVAWALLKVTGLWYEPSRTGGAYALLTVDLLESLRWIPLELATALAALVALRRVHFGILALPVAAALPVVAAQAMPLFIDPEISGDMAPWLNLVSAVVVIACGYWVDQHPRDDEDYARWAYLVGLVTLTVGVMGAWQAAGYERHGLPALAAGLFALSLFLRRPTFLVFGAIAFVGYLAYLAFDVFRTALSFPVVLATFGICVIVLTVLVQRRYPALARRVEEHQAGVRAVPHAGLVFGGAVLVALTLYAVQLPAARERVADRWAQTRLMSLRMHRMRTQSPARRAQARPTPPPPKE